MFYYLITRTGLFILVSTRAQLKQQKREKKLKESSRSYKTHIYTASLGSITWYYIYHIKTLLLVWTIKVSFPSHSEESGRLVAAKPELRRGRRHAMKLRGRRKKAAGDLFNNWVHPLCGTVHAICMCENKHNWAVSLLRKIKPVKENQKTLLGYTV